MMSLRFHVRDRVFGVGRQRSTADSGSELVSAAPGTTGAPVGYGGSAASPPRPAAHGSDPITLDTMTWDQPDKSAAYLVPGDKKMLIDAGCARNAEGLAKALEHLGIEQIDFVALTHIHPDQAGGAGHLAQCFPEAQFLIHPDGMATLADGDRLTDRMKTSSGDNPVESFGLPTDVPAERIRPVADGETVDLGDREVQVIATPGHTAAHLSWLDLKTKALFCGDALGVLVPGSRMIRPATPPVDFCHQRSLDSIKKLRECGAESIHRSHFGTAPGRQDEESPRISDAA